MKFPIISIICAIAENRAIGSNNKLLWNIPEDMKFFRETTKGHTVIMGRKTFESIGKPLPKRINILVTRDSKYKAEGCVIASSVSDAIEFAKENESEEIFIIGGGQIYEQSMKYADKLYLTIVKGDFEADTFFPDYSDWKVVKKIDHNNGQYEFSFIELEK